MGIKIHITDPANAYHLNQSPQRTGWHNLYGSEADALNGNISRVILTGVPQSIKSSNYTQETDFCCGSSSLAITLGMANDAEPHAWLVQKGLMTSAWGTVYSGIRDYLRVKGYNATYDGAAYDGAMSGKCYTDIVNHLKAGYKAILCMHHPRSRFWTSGGHYIVADGISDGGTTTTTTSSSNKIAEDGLWGCGTTKKAQSVFTPNCLDGIVSNQNRDAKGSWENCQSASWEWVAPSKLKNGSGLIRAIQKKLGITADGFAGNQTCCALQKFLGVKVDGRFGVNSVKAFQKWLNKQ